ncbi:hypothetical protein [Kitasatospora sp. NPDC008115]|uniref:hypothetical protein n=1 Tax=Kitasatospora sp. NPDC008115 TaxID=3364022 RepID=UPI0036E1C423
MVILVANAIVPGLLDRYLARTGFDSQQSGERRGAGGPDNLFEPVDTGQDFGAPGRFDDRARARSLQQQAAQGTATAVARVRGMAGRLRASPTPGPCPVASRDGVRPHVTVH